MLVYILALISFLGFLASFLIHVVALFGHASPTSAIFLFVLFALAILLIGFGAFIFPSSISTATGWGFRKMGHNFWRPIPQNGIVLIRFASVYGIVALIIAVLFSNSGDSLSVYKALSGIPVCLFVFHSISYWYHSPAEIRDDFMSMFKTKKHLKRHRKHD